MMRRGIGRVGRPGLLGTAARTAVIAGTATAVSGKVAANQHAKAEAQQQAAQAAAQPQVVVAAAAEVSAGPSQADIDMLKQLADLHAQGILTDEEFAAKKSQILGM